MVSSHTLYSGLCPLVVDLESAKDLVTSVSLNITSEAAVGQCCSLHNILIRHVMLEASSLNKGRREE